MASVSDVECEGDGGRSLSREDCLCPICLEIFMEPVTLPCSHSFCKVCFLESVDKATLCCPLCRKRVAVWARQHSRTKSLVNEALWARIREAFPQHRPQEELCEPVFCPRLSEPGALRQEYEDQVSKLTEEKRELEEQERRASEEFIQRLLAEEEQLLRERQQRHEEDERLARLLNTELNSGPDLAQSREPAAEKKKPTGIDRFLLPISRSPAHSAICNKENLLTPPEPPPLDYYGPHIDQSQPQDREINQSQPCRPPAEGMDQSQLTDGPVEGRTKRKSMSEGAESQGKRSCQSSSLLGVALGEWEAELQRRRRQEEEDLQVALELQRELDRQTQNTDRRKGSADAYPLRAPRRAPTTTGTTSTPARKRPPTSTVTLSMLNTESTPLSPQCPVPFTSALTTPIALTSPSALTTPIALTTPSALTTPTTLTTPTVQKHVAIRTKSVQDSPQTTRQTTLTDLFNLRR